MTAAVAYFLEGKADDIMMAYNPDETVACDAAVPAVILSGGDAQGLLLDVAPLTLDAESVGDMIMRLYAIVI